MLRLTFWQELFEQAATFGWLNWVVTVTALIYVFLAAREKVWAWFWGIISCSLWAYASFVFYSLWLDALLQVFYVIMGFIGIWQWKFGGQGQHELSISLRPWRFHLIILLAGSAVALIFGYFFAEYTPAAATYLDAFTTVFAIIATLLLVRKILENWLYWVIIDLVYIYLYSSRGAYLFALVMGVYVLIALMALRRWWKTYQFQLKAGAN